jgi:hypothetical protein
VTVLATVIDPDGVPVDLTDTQWDHICEQRPRLAELRDEILRSVSKPDATAPGKKPNETWFFLRGVGPTAWLRVVVAYEGRRGWIVTAFPRRRYP